MRQQLLPDNILFCPHYCGEMITKTANNTYGFPRLSTLFFLDIRSASITVIKIIEIIFVPNIAQTAVASGFRLRCMAFAPSAKKQFSFYTGIGWTNGTESAANRFIFESIINF
jgi:hypothetical protein